MSGLSAIDCKIIVISHARRRRRNFMSPKNGSILLPKLSATRVTTGKGLDLDAATVEELGSGQGVKDL